MAYLYKPEDEQQQGQGPAKSGGSVLAGNSGAKSGTGGQAGTSGWTNLQTYLGANEGNGTGVANTIVDEGQKAFDTDVGIANKQADSWGDMGVKAADSTSALNQISDARGVVKTSGSQYNTAANNASAITYGGPQNASDVQGFNDLDQAYKNAEQTADNFGKFNTQQATLQKKYGYSAGMGALDTAIGRGDAGSLITDWQAKSKGGLKDGDQYAGIKKNVDRVSGAIQGSKDSISAAKQGLQSDIDARAKADKEAADARAAYEAARKAEGDGGAVQASFPGINPEPTETAQTDILNDWVNASNGPRTVSRPAPPPVSAPVAANRSAKPLPPPGISTPIGGGRSASPKKAPPKTRR